MGNIKKLQNSQGSATVEFALILPVMVILLLVIVNMGELIHSRLIITNISREAANASSRFHDIEVKTHVENLINLLEVSGRPLDLAADGRIIITKITSGQFAAAPDPQITEQIVDWNLGGVTTSTSQDGLGLSGPLYSRLVFDPLTQSAGIPEITVVEVFFKFKPMLPVPDSLRKFFFKDGDGIVMDSKAIF
jgi:hypothetical protein